MSKDSIKYRERVTIQADRMLDCRAHHIFVQACREADHPAIRFIVVDLSATQGIRASGVGILLMLIDWAKRLRVQLHVVNCNPSIRTQLSSSRLLANLSIS